MKPRMTNGNTMNDMEMVNVKNQMKMGEMMKKIGKGKRKVSATFGLGSRRYLHKLIDELKKQMTIYEKQLPNMFSFFDYLQKQVEVVKVKGKKKQKTKDKTKSVLLSYEELDFLKMQIRETTKGIKTEKEKLKWNNLIKKALYKTLLKQNELLSEELSKAK